MTPLVLPADVRAWALAEGFVPSAPGAPYLEKAWSHSSGYGFVSLRIGPLARVPDDPGVDLVVRNSLGDEVVGLGWCETLADAQQVYAAISRLTYQAGGRT